MDKQAKSYYRLLKQIIEMEKELDLIKVPDITLNESNNNSNNNNKGSPVVGRKRSNTLTEDGKPIIIVTSGKF